MKFRNLEIVGLDFETFYSTHYTLNKIDTPLYVADKQFKIHGVGIEDGYYILSNIRKALNKIDWNNTALLCYNTAFDAYTLKYHYDIVPAYYLDGLSMARPLYQNILKKIGLDSVSKYLGFAGKTSDILERTKGKRWLSAAEDIEMGEYCKQDVSEMYKVFNHMLPNFPDDELDLIDMTIRMFANPKFQADVPRITKEIHRIEKERDELFARTKFILPSSDEDVIKVLRSSEKFAGALKHNGIKVPTKISPTTGKSTYAFAKTDLGFKELAESDDPVANLLYEARLKSKSDNALNKAKKLLAYSELKTGIPAYLNYAKGVTLRWSGKELQMQNMGRGGEMRKSLIAPEGHMICVADSSQIEARTLAWLAEQDSILDVFSAGQDIYKVMAAKIYTKTVPEVTKAERFLGKCIAEGSQILTDVGEIPIEKLTTSHRVWDGVEWVSHEGIIYKGECEVIEYEEIIGTPEHVVYLQNGRRATLEYAKKNNCVIAKAGNGGTPIRLSEDFIESNTKKRKKELSSCRSTMSNMQNSEMDKCRKSPARNNERLSEMQSTAESAQMVKSANGSDASKMHKSKRQTIQKLWSTWNNVRLFFTDRSSIVGTIKSWTTQRERNRQKGQQQRLYTGESTVCNTEAANNEHKEISVKRSRQNMGKTTIPLFRKIYTSIFKRRFNPQRNSAPSTRCNNQQKEKLENYTRKARVYDIVNAGPRNRFTCHNLVLSNCALLGLGYGMSAPTFQRTLKQGALGPSVDLPLEECQRIVNVYREENDLIKALWDVANNWLDILSVNTNSHSCPDYKGLRFEPGKVWLPNGMFLNYHNMTYDNKERSYHYQSTNGRTKYIYGQLLVENITQSLARIVVGEQALQIQKKAPVLLLVHDEVITMVKEEEAQNHVDDMVNIMKIPPKWCSDIPLDAEAGYAKEYSK